MKKIKVALFAILSMTLVTMFGSQVFAAVYLTLNITGNLSYSATEIGADIFATYSLNSSSSTNGTANYVSFSGGGGVSKNNVYSLTGIETSYSNIEAELGTISFTNKSQQLEIYIFIKNTGEREIIPSVLVTPGNNQISQASTEYFFNVNKSNISDPLTIKNNSASASAFVTNIETEINNSNFDSWVLNSTVDKDSTYAVRILLNISSSSSMVNINTTFSIDLSFIADIQYTSNDILTVYQPLNSTSPEWIKYGYNATLDATPTQIESNSLSNLRIYLEDQNEYGNPLKTVSDVYSESVPVYKDIDVVNVDINTGEVIGKLSNGNYPFEWFGRTITLPAGTLLASGRKLTVKETFTVDVYTYYPTMYIRRWTAGGNQWISLSDKAFVGAVKVNSYYTATFETTIYNPDNSVATNSYGIIARSYANDMATMSTGSNNYFQTYYKFGTYSGSTVDPTQLTVLNYYTNLTKKWENYASINSDKAPYTTANVVGVQGENWTAYVYDILYLVKYANNDSQAKVGEGNSYTCAKYNQSGVTLQTPSGTNVGYGLGISAYQYYEASKGGATIGVYDELNKGTATYTSGKLNETGFNTAGFNYGFNSSYTYQNPLNNGNDKTGLYMQQFLTYNYYSNGVFTKRYLCDGYVGSNGYTSVFCLGLANPWGNYWTTIYGSVSISDGTNLYHYVQFDDYDYKYSDSYDYTNGNYILKSYSGFSDNTTRLQNAGYTKLGYTLFTETKVKPNHLGTSPASEELGLEMLVGLPCSDTSSGGGLCDIYESHVSTGYIGSLIKGGQVNTRETAGIFNFFVALSVTGGTENVGFRAGLISA